MPYIKFCFLNIYKSANDDHICVAILYSLIFFSQVFSLVFIDVFLWIEISPAFLVIGLFLTCCIFYNIIICHISDPGVIKTGNLQLSLEETLKESEKRKNNNNTLRFHTERYCSTCKIMRPPKASHCSSCNHCVKGFDHHCVFLANCIGSRNRSNFLWVLLLVNILLCFRVISGIVAAVYIFKNNEEISTSFNDQINIFIGTFVFFGLGIIVLIVCKKTATYVMICFMITAMIFLICGSAIAFNNVDGLSFYENPIFSFLNISFHFSFAFWSGPLIIFNFSQASILITTKEFWSYKKEETMNKSSQIKKPEFKFTEKIFNIFKILLSKKEKSEL